MASKPLLYVISLQLIVLVLICSIIFSSSGQADSLVGQKLSVHLCVCVCLHLCSCKDKFVSERDVAKLWEVARFDFLQSCVHSYAQFLHTVFPCVGTVWSCWVGRQMFTRYSLSPYRSEYWSKAPGQLHSIWLKNIADDLTSFDTRLLETRCTSKLIFFEAEYYKCMFPLFHCCSD